MIQVLQAVDKANGYCFGDMEERNLQAMMSAAVGADFQFDSYPFLFAAVTHCDSSGFQSKGFRVMGGLIILNTRFFLMSLDPLC